MGRAEQDGPCQQVEPRECVGGGAPEAKGASKTPAVNAPINVATPSRSGGRARDGGGERSRTGTSGLEDLMRRKGVDEAWTALEEMQKKGVATDKYTVSRMLMKTVGDGRTRLNPGRVYRGIALVERFIETQPKDVDEVLFNALLDTCCRLKDLSRLEATVNRMRELKVTPSPVTLGILVKTYGQAGDLPKVLQVWSDMEKQRGQANAVTYGCMIDACVKCGNLDKAVEIFKGMRQAGKHRNTILYTTLIKGYGMDKDLKSALELFREMPQEGVPYNTITYNSILDACIKCGDLATGESLLREMTAPGSSLEPDLITFSTLLKGYCHIGDLERALQTAEAIKARGLRCDELVYNTLMDGCVKANDVSAGVGLFEEMVQTGLRPSAITHSILERLYQRAGYEDGASDAVGQLYHNHGIERPSGVGDRGKGLGRRWNPRSPHGRAGDRSSNASPTGSPVAGVPAHFGGLQRERSDSSCGDGGWGACMGMPPALPGFGCAAVERSAPSTPHSGPLQASPMGGAGPFLPMEAMRAGMVPPLPGAEGFEGSPYSQASCTPMGSMHPASYSGSAVASPCIMSPQGCVDQHGFSLPASPQMMHAAYGPTGTPLAAQVQAQGSVPQLPAWPFACSNTYPSTAVGLAGAVPGQLSAPSAGEAAMQQVIAVPVLQGSAGPPQTQMHSGGAVPGGACHVYSAAQGGAGDEVLGQPLSMSALGGGGLAAQHSPFPMPLSPPHDLCYGGMMGQSQVYFESWAGAGQPMGGAVQMSGGSQAGAGMQAGCGAAPFLL